MTITRRALTLATLTGTAMAQELYPSRPVNVLVPWGPGGPTDTFARVLTTRLSTDLGQPFVVDKIGRAHV